MANTAIVADSYVIDQLNGLLTKVIESKEGYRKAQKNVASEGLKDLFKDIIRQRERFLNDLKMEIKILGGIPNEETSILSDAHQVWIDLKGTLTSNSEVSILKECIRGEQIAKEQFRRVMQDKSLLHGTKKIVKFQYKEINKVLERMKLLEIGFSN